LVPAKRTLLDSLGLLAIDSQQLDIKNQGGIRRDNRRISTRAITIVTKPPEMLAMLQVKAKVQVRVSIRGNGQLGLFAQTHFGNTLIPALDNLPNADFSFKWLA